MKLLREIHAKDAIGVMDCQDVVFEVEGLETVGAMLVDKNDNG